VAAKAESEQFLQYSLKQGLSPVPCSKSGPPLRKAPILNLGKFHGRGAFHVIVNQKIDLAANGLRARAAPPLSSFMIMASLKAAAALQGCNVADLIPQTELRQYLREK
jgi:hypothetical protein